MAKTRGGGSSEQAKGVNLIGWVEEEEKKYQVGHHKMTDIAAGFDRNTTTTGNSRSN